MIDIKFTLTQLQMFLAVVEHGSFSAAARVLDRAQSAISHSVGQLEASLEVPLFDRSGRTPVLTPAGQALAGEARRVVRQAREMEATAEVWRGQEGQAQFAIVVDMVYPTDCLVAVLAELRAKHPRLALTVYTESRGAVTARLLDEGCQLGVTGILVPDLPTQLETVRIGATSFVAVASPTHPLAAEEGPLSLELLRRHTQIVLEDRSHLSNDLQVGVVGSNVWRIGAQGAKLALLKAGFGWGSLPVEMIENDLAQGSLVRLVPGHWAQPVMQIPLYAIYPADRPPGPVTRDAIRLLRELTPKS